MKLVFYILLLLLVAQFVVIVYDLRKYPQCLNTDNPIVCTYILKELIQ